MNSSKKLIRLLGRALLVGLFAGPASAQIGSGTTIPGWTPPPIPVGPSMQFTWQDTIVDRGTVKAQWGKHFGWTFVGDWFEFRVVTSYTSDPTVEVLVFPPYSGHPTKMERFLLQFPVGANLTGKKRPLVVGFHPFSQSEKAVFNGTALPYICAEKGWMLLAAYGLVDTNYGNMASQVALDAVLELVEKIVHYDPERVYTVGFSMGGGTALSWALRHQDPEGLRVAGVISHTGTQDLIRAYNHGSAATKALMEDADHFGGSPAEVPYEYERISSFQMIGNAIDPDQAYFENLKHIPIFLHWNITDPNWDLAIQSAALDIYLSANGFNYRSDAVNKPLVHHWSTLPMRDAVDWMERHSLPPHPLDDHEFHATEEGRWLYTEVREKNPVEHARYEVSAVDPVQNSFTLTNTFDVGELGFDLRAMGLTPASPLRFLHVSGDSTPDSIVLENYANPPSSVSVNFAPAYSWSHDRIANELTIVPTAAGSFSVVHVTP